MDLNLKTLVKQHAGKWVALKPNTINVISSGSSAKNVYNQAQKKA